MESLGKLFGSVAKVKVMRFFLLNPEAVLATKEVAERAKLRRPAAARELALLETIGLLTQKRRGRDRLWQIDSSFPLLEPLKRILQNDLLGRKRELLKRFGRAGRLSFLALAGIFLGDNDDSRVDLLLVGSQWKRAVISRIVKDLEAEIGRELNYAVLETADFQYRLNACDKFVRDIFDYPHTVLLNKIGLSTGVRI